MECGPVYSNLTDAVKRGLIDENALMNHIRLLKARFELGGMDPHLFLDATEG